MHKINNIDILVMKWKLFISKRKITLGQPNPENPIFKRKS